MRTLIGTLYRGEPGKMTNTARDWLKHGFTGAVIGALLITLAFVSGIHDHIERTVVHELRPTLVRIDANEKTIDENKETLKSIPLIERQIALMQQSLETVIVKLDKIEAKIP